EELAKQGRQFASDTDSEVVADLVALELKTTPDLFQAVQKVIPRLHGAYAILVVWENQPDTLVAFKNGPPLLVGVGQGETVVGSDAQAILPFTNKIIYLEDDEIAHAQKDQVRVYNRKGQLLDKVPVTLNWT